MNKTNIIVGGIAVLALLLGGIAFLRGSSSTNDSPVASTQNYGNTSIDGSQSNLPNASNSDYSVARLAQGFGTNIGNINVETQAQNMVAGTTTVCTIANPFNATSSIMNIVLDVKAGISGGATFALGTTTSGTATSTNVLSSALATNAGGVITWDPSTNNAFLGPNGQITLGFTAGSATGTPYIINGTCAVMLQSVL